jgi:hypothetical protein
VVSETEAKKIMEARGIKWYSPLKKNEVYLLINSFFKEAMTNPKGKNIFMNIDNKETSFKIKDFKDFLLVNRVNLNNSNMYQTIVVSDDVYTKLLTEVPLCRVRVIDITNQASSKDLTNKL